MELKEQKDLGMKLNRKVIEIKWVFPKIGVPQNGGFVRENPVRIDDLGVPLFLQTPKSGRVCYSKPA